MTSFDIKTASLMTMSLLEFRARQLASINGRPEGEWEKFAREADQMLALERWSAKR